jgi:predicted secreted protein with PEFG-CTERM motif
MKGIIFANMILMLIGFTLLSPAIAENEEQVLEIGSETSQKDEIKPGTIIVTSPSTKETTVHGLTSDEKIRVEITASNPVMGEVMSIDVKFRDATGSLKKDVNYDMIVTQNGKQILSVMEKNEPEGNSMYTTEPLDSEGQVDFQITLLGFGLPDDESNWTEPRGEVLFFNIVPEFGTITMMILVIAILSVITLSLKTKNISISKF